MLSVSQSVLLGGVLLVLDLWARSMRLKLLLRGTGADLRTSGAYIATAFGDAASVLTPLRMGGTPARLAVLHRYEVSLAPGLAALALDMATYQAIVAVVGVAVASQAIADIWVAALPRGVPGWAAIGVGCLIAIVVWAALPRMRRRLEASALSLRGLPGAGSRRGFWKVLLLSLPLAAVSILIRISLLPLLALSIPAPTRPPELASLAYTITFGQVLIPTPAGAGAVEYAFAVSGAYAAPGMSFVFMVWRALTVGLVCVMGIGLAVLTCGRSIVTAALETYRRQRGQEGSEWPGSGE
jgi:uncharacterized membrane protein YbhN (UPF0104 family)